MNQKQLAEAYLDSATNEINASTNLTEYNYRAFYDLRNRVVELTVLIKGVKGRKEILDMTGSMGDLKVAGIADWARAFASVNQYHEAVSVIPGLANTDDRLFFYTQILYEEVNRVEAPGRGKWTEFDKAYNDFLNFTIYGFDNI
jgi:hypothetical protein